MKILIYSPNLPFLFRDSSIPIGGITVELYEWIKGFKKNGHQVGILTWENSLKFIGPGNYDNDLDFIEGFELRKNKSVGIKKKSFIKAIRAINKYKPDLIILEGTIDLLYFFTFISLLLNIKFVYRLASDKDSDDRIRNYLKGISLFLHNFALLNLKYISVQNIFQLQMFTKRFPKKKIFLHYNPIMPDCNLEILNKKERSYIAWIGNFRREKNLKSLYETAVKCKEIEFKIAGTEMPEIDEDTKKFVGLLQDLPNVSFEGYIKRADISGFLSRALALLNTSHLEGFSNTFLEAWLVGTPVISTVFVNPDDIINKYSLGLIAKDFAEIPKCINELLNISHKEYTEYSIRCRNYLHNNHSAEKLANEFIRVISEN
jgi:glycosyltransferase involved in cell wall biosynthesis